LLKTFFLTICPLATFSVKSLLSSVPDLAASKETYCILCPVRS